jgi:hypothetical protein
VALAEWRHGLGGNDLGLVTMPLRDSSPVMRRGAGFKGDQAGTLATQKLSELATGQRAVT